MKRIKKPHIQHGFSLLEAIIALLLLSTAGLALFNWINTTLSGLNHALESGKKTQYLQNALELMRQVNPAKDNKGEIKMPGFTLKWRSTAVTPLKQEIDSNGIAGPYLIGLYDCDVIIIQNDNRIDTFTLRQVGYQRIK